MNTHCQFRFVSDTSLSLQSYSHPEIICACITLNVHFFEKSLNDADANELYILCCVQFFCAMNCF